MTDPSGTATGWVVKECQGCGSTDLEEALFLGYLPAVNRLTPIGEPPREELTFPAQWLLCPRCLLVQLGYRVAPEIVFPPDYPYTSGTTRILRENFAELRRESAELLGLGAGDLVVDIGSNDGTLLAQFQEHGHRVQGIEPTRVGERARQRGIPTLEAFFDRAVATRVRAECGPARLVTATNVFAHMGNLHETIEGILGLLDEDGVFVSESHYLIDLLETLQYDTIYHEHLRYYSVRSLAALLRAHGLEVFHVRRIPTHGGSIRVYAARAGRQAARPTVGERIAAESAVDLRAEIAAFRRRIMLAKLGLHELLHGLRRDGRRIQGIGAPSRASTLVHHVGLDESILECVLEVPGSLKIGKYLPGTRIPVRDESHLADNPPDCALILSWHIGDEIRRNLAGRGYAGRFLLPLPVPRLQDAPPHGP